MDNRDASWNIQTTPSKIGRAKLRGSHSYRLPMTYCEITISKETLDKETTHKNIEKGDI